MILLSGESSLLGVVVLWVGSEYNIVTCTGSKNVDFYVIFLYLNTNTEVD